MSSAGVELATLLKGLGAQERFSARRLEHAYKVAVDAYGSEMHWTQVTLLEHVLGVLKTLLPFEPDEDAVVACLLHHLLVSKLWTLKRIEEEFGAVVRSLVRGVHLLSHVTMKGRRMSPERLRLMLLKVSDDMRVVLIILCDRCFVLKNLANLPAEQQRRVSTDVLQLFAPVAARLGIYALKHLLESEAFPVIYPIDAERITTQLKAFHDSSGFFLDGVADQLKKFLLESGVPASVQGREKQPYSIFTKIKRKSLSRIKDVQDLSALRVVVRTEAECYQILGLLHRLGHPLPNRFKDYIAFPKPNGYRGLHTALTGLPGVPDGVFLEVQIRTEEMHREAEYGIAAHWKYKESGATERAVERMQLQRMLSEQQSLEEGGMSSLADHIFVLTPKGDVIELPEGATPLDFAFQVHTDLGLSFQAAKVNGAIVPIDAQLENGDVVEVLRHSTPRPSLRWLMLLRTSSARSKLRRHLSVSLRPEYVARGREVINDELQKNGLPPLDRELSILRHYDGRVFTVAEREDLLMQVGQGSLKVSRLLSQMKGEGGGTAGVRPRSKTQKDSTVIMEGDVQMPMSYARCCQPEEEKGCDLAGVVTRQGMVKVHRASCRMLRQVNRERRVRVWWA